MVRFGSTILDDIRMLEMSSIYVELSHKEGTATIVAVP